MKKSFLIFAVAVICNSKTQAGVVPLLPRLGVGDPNILVWMHPKNPANFTVWTYTGKKELPEHNLSSEMFEKGSLKPLYPAGIEGLAYGFEMQHCYPFGNGQGYLRRITWVLKDPKIQSGPDIYKEQSDIVLFEEHNGVFITKVISDKIVNQEFNLEESQRFLGKLDGIVFYWDQRDKESVFGRDTKSQKTYHWHFKGVYIGLGVLRGNNKDYDFVAYREIHALFSNAYGEQTVIEISVKDSGNQ